MSKWLVLPVVVGQLLMGTAHLNWIPFMSREGGFVLNMPGEPIEEVHPLETVNGRVELHRFATRPAGGTRVYSVLYQKQSDVAAARPAEVTLAGAVRGFAKHAAAGSNSLTSRPCVVQGYPGREVTEINPQGVFIIDHMFVANRRFYQVLVAAPGERVPDSDMVKFLNSFRILQKR